MKLAICDDEKDIRNYIEKSVREVSPHIEVVSFPNAENLLRYGTDADIIFLDIQMPGMDGMKAARILRTTGSRAVIVFVTALEDSVFDAFDVDAVQYIVKPFDKSRLTAAIRKAIDVSNERQAVTDILAGENEKAVTPRAFTVRSGGVNTRVILSDIAYAEIFDRRIVLHMQDRECIEFYGRMTELEHVSGSDFFRIHRAYLINLKYVSSYDSKSVVVMGNTIPVARGKYPEFVKAYMSYYTRLERL
ncbi:MAG: LytTR family DNA-binding domain-containing protein [Lachnospiraceae bacterium]|nr:LytTR family DNA-binding domain-containing protein [Lachnospiraceae bacterium]